MKEYSKFIVDSALEPFRDDYIDPETTNAQLSFIAEEVIKDIKAMRNKYIRQAAINDEDLSHEIEQYTETLSNPELKPSIIKMLKIIRDDAKENDCSIELNIQVDYINRLEKKLKDLRSSKDVVDETTRRKDIAEVLELDTEKKYIVKNKKNKNIKIIDQFALDKLKTSTGKYYRLYKPKNSPEDPYIVLSDEEYRKILDYNARPFQDWKLEEIEKSLETQIEKSYQKVEEFDSKRYEGVFDKKKNFKSLEDLQKYVEKKIKKKDAVLRDELMKQALEIRAEIMRKAQKENRAKIRSLGLQSINMGKKPNYSRILDKEVNNLKRKLERTGKKVATIGFEQRLVTNERLFAPSKRTWKDIFFKDGKRWRRTAITVPVDVTPKLESVEYEILGILKPAIVNNTKATWVNKKDRKKEEVDYGCLLAATYFYQVVSTTPIDEDYQKGVGGSNGEKMNYWEKARISLKKHETNSYRDEFKSIEEIREDLEARGTRITSTSYRTHEHKADNKVVRGDWTMIFRGVNFKAFDTEQDEANKPFFANCMFEEEDFYNPITGKELDDLDDSLYSVGKNGNFRIRNLNFKPYIWKIAKKIEEALFTYNKEFDPTDLNIKVENLNPRWQILEYGGYESDSSGPWKGLGRYRYKHGVNQSGFVYQAPRGFWRVANAQYNAIITKSSMLLKNQKYGAGEASAYTRGNRNLFWNYDVSKLDEPQYEELMKVFAEQDETLTVNNIHNINKQTVWKWEKM